MHVTVLLEAWPWPIAKDGVLWERSVQMFS